MLKGLFSVVQWPTDSLAMKIVEMMNVMIMKPSLVEWSCESESAAKGEKLLNSKLCAS